MRILASVDLLTQCIDSTLLLLDSSADQPQEPPPDMLGDQLDEPYLNVYLNADVTSLCMCAAWSSSVPSWSSLWLVSKAEEPSLGRHRGANQAQESWLPLVSCVVLQATALYVVNILHWL